MPVTYTKPNGEKIVVEDCDRTVCECWTRVMGYYRPVENFNIGKKQEFKERVWFREDVALSPIQTEE